jgi:tetratricopeptide (TPR) repeat protein
MTDPLAEKIGINVQGGTVNVQNLNIGIAERLAQVGDRVRILVVAANPLGSSPLKLDHEVKTIQEALTRSRKRDNFVVEYRLAATPSELRRALLDVEPHVLHFSGHGAGEKGLLFVSDESAGAIYRSDSGEVRSRSTDSNEIKFVPAQPLANLLQLCEDHLECVVLNACYSDVQGNAISANIPFTIGMRDVVEDNVAIKFSQGFYDAIGAGKGYESAFKWGKVAIEFDLANDEAAKILVLRRKGETIQIIEKTTANVDSSRTEISPNESNNFFSGLKKLFTPSLSAKDYFSRAYVKSNKGDNEGAISDYNESIRLGSKDVHIDYNYRGLAKAALGDNQGAIADCNEAIRLNPKYADAYNTLSWIKYLMGNSQEALLDVEQSLHLNTISAAAHHTHGSILFYGLRRSQDAIAAFTKAIALEYNDSESYCDRGIVMASLGDNQKAIADFTEAIRFNSSWDVRSLADAYYNRGNTYQQMRERQESLADFWKASELYQEQGNTEWYNKSLDSIRELCG